MALYELTIKNNSKRNGIQLDKGMSVEVSCNSNPVSHNSGKLVYEAFERKYGIDAKKAGALTSGGYTLIKK